MLLISTDKKTFGKDPNKKSVSKRTPIELRYINF